VPSRNSDEKREVLEQLFGSIGSRTWIEAPFYCDYGENINIGSDCFINGQSGVVAVPVRGALYIRHDDHDAGPRWRG
jgi:acetyltransferase-like isoleucine patch superfamily enzyme